jgi:16S rRNA (guanine527-N7)-methyltransferase
MDPEKEFVNTLITAASAIGHPLSDREISLFRDFRRELLFWNDRMNLISIKTPLDLPIKHCIDSLLAAPCVQKQDGSLLDIGAGAGFPGIPLKIAIPSLAVSLLDSSRKKTSFLRAVVARLRLEKISVIQGRVEQLTVDPQYVGAFDTVISRAAFKLAELITLGSRLLSANGQLIAMKGRDVAVELEDVRRAVDKAGLRESSCRELRLPVLGDERKIIVFSRY